MIKRSTSFTTEEYYNLIKSLVDQQYHDTSSDDVYQETWIPAESEIKQKIKSKDKGMVDLTDVKKDKIKDFILKSNTIKVGDFLIKITKSDYTKSDMSDLKMNMCIYEEKTHTQAGGNCKMLYKLDSTKDSRFSKCNWNSYFNQFKYGNSITIDVLIDIVRWLQAIRKLTAFI